MVLQITLQPQNFTWPNSESQEAQQIGWDDYKISDIINFLQETFDLQNICVYSDQYQENRLQEELTILQQGLSQNCTLYLFHEENLANGEITVKLYLDGEDTGQACQISSDNTCQEIIEQIFEGHQISRMELKNQDFQLLASDPFMQIKNIPNFGKDLHLFAYTHHFQQQIDLAQKNKSINQELKNESVELDYNSTIKLKNIIVIVDKKGKSAMFEFLHHHFKGILTEENGLAFDYNGQLQFKNKNGLEYAPCKNDLGLVIKWPNGMYSSIELNEIKNASQIEEIELKINSIDLLHQLLILKQVTLFIDPNGKYLFFKYKQGKLKLEGQLLQDNSVQMDIDEKDYEFIEHSSLKIAYNDQKGFGILIKWSNNRFSSVKVIQK